MTGSVNIIHGECESEMAKFADNSFDAGVADPPYGIRFMGKAWDGKDIEERTHSRKTQAQNPNGRAGPNGEHNSIAAEAGKYSRTSAANRAFQSWTEVWAREMFRILKPGAYLVSFSSTRTYHRMTCGIEDAGFEIRDQLAWTFGSGFPKSLNVGAGRGTALKPGWEPICLARKPIDGNVVGNLAKYGTGALNIDACRIPFAGASDEQEAKEKNQHGKFESGPTNNQVFGKLDKPRDDYNASGRWPANLVHDGSDEVTRHFPSTKSAGHFPASRGHRGLSTNGHGGQDDLEELFLESGGSAARFFFCAKASRADRDAGLEGFASRPLARSNGAQSALSDDMAYTGSSGDIGLNKIQHRANHHPTVKPTELMRWLCRLVTPPNGHIIDPFLGSGSTGRAAFLEGFSFTGIEREADYIPIAKARIAEAKGALFSTP